MPAAAQKPPLSKATAEFGRRVREARLALELSQERLAERADLHWSYLGQVERGQNNLTLHNILKIASALDVDPGRLVEGLPTSDLMLSGQSRLRPQEPRSAGRVTRERARRPRSQNTPE